MDNTENVLPQKSVKLVKGQFSMKPEKSIGTLIISDLLPFRQLMKRQLNGRGYYVNNMNFKNLVPLYFNEFASNQFDKTNLYVPVNHFDFINNVAFQLKDSDKLSTDINSRNINNFEGINNVVNGIFSMLKRSKDKRINNIALTDEERQQANEVDRVETKIENKIFNDQTVKVKHVKYFLLIAIIGLSIYYLCK